MVAPRSQAGGVCWVWGPRMSRVTLSHSSVCGYDFSCCFGKLPPLWSESWDLSSHLTLCWALCQTLCGGEMKATGKTWMMIKMPRSSRKVTRGTESSYKGERWTLLQEPRERTKNSSWRHPVLKHAEKKKTGVLDKRQEAELSRACYSKNLHNKAVIWQTSA